jgi:hypothetical protein
MKRDDLEKLPAPKLRELALEKYPEVKGVTGMKKEALVEAIIAEAIRLGHMEKEAEAAERRSTEASKFKAQIRSLKAERDRIMGARDAAGLKEVRNKIKRLKRRLRGLREAS